MEQAGDKSSQKKIFLKKSWRYGQEAVTFAAASIKKLFITGFSKVK